MHFAAIGFPAGLDCGLHPHLGCAPRFAPREIISDNLRRLGRRSRVRAGWLSALAVLAGCAGSVSSPTLVGSASLGFEYPRRASARSRPSRARVAGWPGTTGTDFLA